MVARIRPGTGTSGVLELEQAEAGRARQLVVARAQRRVIFQVAEVQLPPGRLGDRHGPREVGVDAPLAGAPRDDLIGTPGELAIDPRHEYLVHRWCPEA